MPSDSEEGERAAEGRAGVPGTGVEEPVHQCLRPRGPLPSRLSMAGAHGPRGRGWEVPTGSKGGTCRAAMITAACGIETSTVGSEGRSWESARFWPRLHCHLLREATLIAHTKQVLPTTALTLP